MQVEERAYHGDWDSSACDAISIIGCQRLGVGKICGRPRMRLSPYLRETPDKYDDSHRPWRTKDSGPAPMIAHAFAHGYDLCRLQLKSSPQST